MKINFYESPREYYKRKEEFDKAVHSVIENGMFILGEEVNEFEKEIESYTGAKHAIGVSSGTEALVIATDILGFKDGKEVITTPFTFLASASCIARNKAKPVFVDIDKETCEMNVQQIEYKINENTAGIIPVHLFNQISNMDKIMETSNKYNLKVLEDAAEAFGMKWKNGNSLKHAGTIGDMGIFSFFPTKTLGGYGDGGMIITNDDSLAELAKIYRVHGAASNYNYDYIGYNSRLDSIQAAILRVKLKYIDEAIKNRNRIAEIYKKNLNDIPQIKISTIKYKQEPVYYVFNIVVEKRNELQIYLKEKGISTNIYYPRPLHTQKCFEYLGYKKGDFPVAEAMCEKILALPIYPELKDEEVNYICDKIKEFYI